MPYSYPNSVPKVSKNWTAEEQRKCTTAANAVLKGGGSDADAIFACIRAAGKSKRHDAIRPHVRAVLARRLRMSGRRKLPKPAVPIHPRQVQNSYFDELKRVMAALKHVLKSTVLAHLGTILNQAAALRPKKDSSIDIYRGEARIDTYSDEIKDLIHKAKIQFSTIVPPHQAKAIAQKIAMRTNAFNARDMNKVFKSVIGVDVFRNEHWLEQEMKAFVADNVGYIESIPEQFFGRIEDTIFRAARSGDLLSDTADKLESDYDITEGRAALIARDQVSKFNSNLTELRQKEVGVEKYIWQTAEDDRVRQSHEELDQTEQSWDDPPEGGGTSEGETGHPGEGINCRCVAIPVFEDVSGQGDEGGDGGGE